jgi:hypothetical protein
MPYVVVVWITWAMAASVRATSIEWAECDELVLNESIGAGVGWAMADGRRVGRCLPLSGRPPQAGLNVMDWS